MKSGLYNYFDSVSENNSNSNENSAISYKNNINIDNIISNKYKIYSNIFDSSSESKIIDNYNCNTDDNFENQIIYNFAKDQEKIFKKLSIRLV